MSFEEQHLILLNPFSEINLQHIHIKGSTADSDNYVVLAGLTFYITEFLSNTSAYKAST